MTDQPKTTQQLLSQWHTPTWVAKAMWARASLRSPVTLLEPAAGTGQLILPVDEMCPSRPASSTRSWPART